MSEDEKAVGMWKAVEVSGGQRLWEAVGAIAAVGNEGEEDGKEDTVGHMMLFCVTRYMI